MVLFQTATSTQAKLKAGIFGGAGSGKTRTATEIAIGLVKYMKSPKPVYFQDTETGSDFVKPLFDAAGVELRVMKKRTFKDLLEGAKEAEQGGSILIIDSETHIWEDFKKQYLRETGQAFIELWDWAKLKEKWQEWTDFFVNSDLHIIRCGRAAAVYEQQEELRGGNRKNSAVKVGSKMKTESEGGYEPSLLLEMEKVFVKKQGKTGGNGLYLRKCHVVKDRFDAIDSKDFEDPKFDDFLPHIKLLNLKAAQQGVDTSKSKDTMFDLQGNDEKARRAKRRAILCEEISGLLSKYLGGSADKMKLARQELVFEQFGTRSWKALEEDWQAVPLEKIEELMRRGENLSPGKFETAVMKRADEIKLGQAAS